MTRIAVVGMACRYPDADSPRTLWENVIAGRRAFRRLPDERMRLEDYWDQDPGAPDRMYARMAAVIEGYSFDRVAYKVAGSTYRSTDLTHWLALDIAALALADAGFANAEGLPKERTGVIVGNTLTGEFTRANVMRLRWPYVRRVVGRRLTEEGWDDDRIGDFLQDLEAAYKGPFPAVDEDTLAGGLSNTIPGRICNHFDLGGGGYTVDGACASSLLSVSTACRMITDGDVDVAVAGGVDLSIDPFEIVGFAKTGALAKGEMRVYDRASSGFWPGEGCGMVVLMREEDARSAGHRIYATIAGWGIASDGRGGITRPVPAGYRRALRQAYDRAGFGIETVELFEGHGTGTPVGDANELRTLSEARADAASPAAIGSIKGMIGHTKAAAGVAGLIKAVLSVHEQVLPPSVGCVDPHEHFGDESARLRVLRKAEPWPAGSPVRAGVTAMGFGGINTHVVLDGAGRRTPSPARTRTLASAVQDMELLLVAAPSAAELRDQLAGLLETVQRLSYADLADLAAVLQRDLHALPYRAALVVSSPDDAEKRLRQAIDRLDGDGPPWFAEDGRVFLGHVTRPGRTGFLFPGQGSGRGTSGGALRRRFPEVEEVYTEAALPSDGDMVATAVAQPRIVTGSMAGLRALSLLGVEAAVAVGHSLGEISALHWAGAMDEASLLRVAQVRGQTMAEHSSSGTMAGVAAPPEKVGELAGDLPVVIAGYNGPGQTVIAGPVDAIEEFGRTASAAGVTWSRLRVSHAFHSPLVEPAAGAFGERLADEAFDPIDRPIVSTVTGRRLERNTPIPDLLRRQIVDPVLFSQAVEEAAAGVDLFIEVGPGQVLSPMSESIADVPAIALDTDCESSVGLLRVAGAAFAAGVMIDTDVLFHGRPNRPLEIGRELSFFASPCEMAPEDQPRAAVPREVPAAGGEREETLEDGTEVPAGSSLELLRGLAAERAELPMELVTGDSHFLDDLHLSSITVGKIVEQAARRLGGAPGHVAANLATATIGELAEALDEMAQSGTADAGPQERPESAAPWSRPYRVDMDELPLPAPAPAARNGAWQAFAPDGHPYAERMRTALENAGVGAGVLVCLPEGCPEADLELALRGAKAAASGQPDRRFALVQHDRGAAGLAKTLQLEVPHLRVTVVHLPCGEEPDRAVERVTAEVAATATTSEVSYADGVRRVPTLRAMPAASARTEPPLTEGDVLLVTGGGKGITAECALAVATSTGAALAVLGRSDPGADEELAANLRHMGEQVRVHYARADVTRPDEVRAAVGELSDELGPITAVLHGAGRNEPGVLPNLEMEDFRTTLAPKIDGLHAVLDAVDPGRLRLLVTLGSIIGRAGLHGEAHYATANEWLADLTQEFAAAHPECRCICMEWSVWSGVGMGERMSVVDSLVRDGITPVTPEQGVEITRRLVCDPDAPEVVVICGRTEGIDTVRYDVPDLPLLRYVERPLVRYHGVEFIAEVDLNAGTDHYLADHELDGNLLFPAVFGMEAMTQAATTALGRTDVPVIEDAEFLRPIVVAPDGVTTVRIAATVTGGPPGEEIVEVTIRSAESVYTADHFRARLRFGAERAPEGPPDQIPEGLPPVPVDPRTEMYGDLLFQGRRFQRLRRYHRAAARHVDAGVEAVNSTDWFASFLPGELILGDPGLRDALMHGNQVCVPDATLLPTAVERIYPGGAALSGELRYCATERERDGDRYIYDIAVRNDAGEVVERWEGLHLQAVRKQDGRGPWVEPLIGPYLERTVEDLTGTRVAVAVEPLPEDSGAERVNRLAVALGRTLGRPVEAAEPEEGAASCGAGVTLCVSGPGLVGCDVQAVSEECDAGPYADLIDRIDEGPDTARARVAAMAECLRKAGVVPDGPIGLEADASAWAVFDAGSLAIATLATTLRDDARPVVFAILVERGTRV